MLSYKDWKNINESVGLGAMALGLGQPQSIGITGGTGASEEVVGEGKMKKKMHDDEELMDEPQDDADVDDEEDEDVVDVPDEEDDEEDMEDVKCMGKKCGKKMKKKMKEEQFSELPPEEQAWWSSINGMVNANPNTKYYDGISANEDALLPPENSGSAFGTLEEPKPGEVGYAPQQRVGGNVDGHTPADPGWKYENS